MADLPWEHAAEAREALNAIVTDPEHGVAALSSPRTMSNLLKDLLPDAPREKNLLVAAAEAGLADTLRDHVSQGMDTSTAIRLAASSFSAKTPMSTDACNWVTGEIAVAMGISQTNDAPIATSNPSAGLDGSASSDGRSPVPDGRSQVPDGHPPVPDWASPVQDRVSPASTAYGPGSAAVSPPGATGYSPGASGYSPGAAGYAPGAAAYTPAGPGYAPGAAPYPPGGTAFLPGQVQQGYGAAQAMGAGYPVAPGQGPVPGYQPVPARRSNSLAVTSLVLGFTQAIGWFIFLVPGLVLAILAIVFGFVSMQQVKRSGEAGRGLAVAGVILGFAGIGIVGLLIIIGIAAINNQPGTVQ